MVNVNCKVPVYMESRKRSVQKQRVCVYLVLSDGERERDAEFKRGNHFSYCNSKL